MLHVYGTVHRDEWRADRQWVALVDGEPVGEHTRLHTLITRVRDEIAAGAGKDVWLTLTVRSQQAELGDANVEPEPDADALGELRDLLATRSAGG